MFLTFIEVLLWALVAHIPQNLPQWRQAIRLCLVGTHTIHSQDYMTGNDLVKLSWRNSRKPFKKVQGRLERAGFHSHNSNMLWSILVIQKQLKCFRDEQSPSIEENIRDVSMRRGGGENLPNVSYFEIAAYSLLVDCFIFQRFYWGSFVCYVNSGARALHNTSWPKVDKLCQSKAIGHQLVETDRWHCPGYLTGAESVKLSWQTRSKLCKKKFVDDRDEVGDPLTSLSLFFWGCQSRGTLFFSLVCQRFSSS